MPERKQAGTEGFAILLPNSKRSSLRDIATYQIEEPRPRLLI
jgi:hypothetical protein